MSQTQPPRNIFSRITQWYINEPKHLKAAYIGLFLWGIFSYLNWKYRWIARCPYNKYIVQPFSKITGIKFEEKHSNVTSQIETQTLRSTEENIKSETV